MDSRVPPIAFVEDHPLTGSPLHQPHHGCSAGQGGDLGASIRSTLGPGESEHVREAILSGSLTDPVSLPFSSSAQRAGFAVASPLHGKGQVGYTPATSTADCALQNQRSTSTGGGGGVDTPSHRRNDPYFPRYTATSANTTPFLCLQESELEHITTVQVREVSHRQTHTPCAMLYVNALPTTPHAQLLPRPLSATATATTAATAAAMSMSSRTPVAVHDATQPPPKYPTTIAKGQSSSHTPTHNNNNNMNTSSLSMGGSFHCNPSGSMHMPHGSRAFSPTLYTSDVPQLEATLAYAGVACDPAHCLDPEEGGQVVVQRIAQRNKQIAIGKQTVGYARYVAAVSMEAREVNYVRHPITPRADYDCSKRTFDKVLSEWRKGLHEWDPEKTDTATAAAEEEEEGEGGVSHADDEGLDQQQDHVPAAAPHTESSQDVPLPRRTVREVVLEARDQKLKLQQWTPPPRRSSMHSPPLLECGGPQGSGFLAPAAIAAPGSMFGSAGAGRRSSNGTWLGHQDLSPMHVAPGLHGSTTANTVGGSPVYHQHHFRSGFTSPQQVAMPTVRLPMQSTPMQPYFPNFTDAGY